MNEVEKSEYAKKGKEFVDDISKTVGKTAESVKEHGENIARSQVFRSVSEASGWKYFFVSVYAIC